MCIQIRKIQNPRVLIVTRVKRRQRFEFYYYKFDTIKLSSENNFNAIRRMKKRTIKY